MYPMKWESSIQPSLVEHFTDQILYFLDVKNNRKMMNPDWNTEVKIQFITQSCRCRNTHSHNGSFSFSLAPEVEGTVLDVRGFWQYPFQYLLFIRRQLVKVNAEHIENDRPHFSEIIPGRLNSLSDFQSHLLCKGIIRRAVNVMLMGFPYVMENGVPCFVRHMTEEIFFLYECMRKSL